MKSFASGLVILAATGANALVARDGTCCFGISASGPGANSTVDQLGDGQNRVGGTDLTAGTFCIDSSGGLTDGNGRGCIITPETSQFQCDLNKTASPGFSVGSNGIVAHNGSTSFVICKTGGNGENIYLHDGSDVTMCTPTTLTADNCKNSASSSCGSEGQSSSSVIASSSVAPVSPVAESSSSIQTTTHTLVSVSPATSTIESTTPQSSVATETLTPSVPTSSAVPASSAPESTSTISTTVTQSSTATETLTTSVHTSSAVPATSSAATDQTSTASSTTSSSSSCATTLTNGSYQYPHLIIPVSSTSPDTAYGTSYDGMINSTTSTIFNFDIPSTYAGQTCSLVFNFPTKAELETSDYTFSGDGKLDFKKLSQVATQATTYSSTPSTTEDYGVTTISAGNGYVINTFSCPAGTAVSYEISQAQGGDTSLWFFEDWNPSPLGLFITVC